MIVLGIETTCDETAVAVVVDGHEILSNIIASQTDLHAEYGGVFPELASRRHLEAILPTVEEALRVAEVRPEEIDLVAVAQGPGLLGSLSIGLNAAKGLAFGWNKPLIGVNHVEAHLYAAMMGKENIPLPALGVIISGGHTVMVRIEAVGEYEMIGATVDDAIGEAFDKVASLLDLAYPGGPLIEKLAKEGNPEKYPFRAGKVKGRPWDFSFSGLKTKVLYAVKGQNSSRDAPSLIDEEDKADIAASFQRAALSDIVEKSLAAARDFGCASVVLGGGVSQNMRLREMFHEESCLPIFWPEKELCGDNGAMIAGLGKELFEKRGGDPLSIEPVHRIPFESISP